MFYDCRLTHVDDGSPFNFTELIRRAALRSQHRRQLLKARITNTSPANLNIPVTPVKFEYKIDFSIGTPRLPISAVLDTGSELVWTQCRPCEQCVEQVTPIYDPSKSSSFSKIPCTSPMYAYELFKQFNPPKCQYACAYGSASTRGVLATETFSFGGKHSAKLTFGCSRESRGDFAGTAGIVGLGQGKLSLISQLKFNKFSYCFTPFNSSRSSHLLLGSRANLERSASGEAPQSTPFLNDTNFYYVALRRISLGKTFLPIPSSIFQYKASEGRGTVVDSGNGQSQLPQPAYDVIKKKITSFIRLPVRNMSSTVGLDHCFAVSSWPPHPAPPRPAC
ncbi:aspartic proteinase nepenthesin-1-like [Canna indica]|uniref:Aspartic proteinase nepenthesin-1-like n=1 Tax=Canna indica TaxID=4628 RepID=A0AAQ3KRS0_9LILI|nr:aspartic proteinase nepenthesin-1-like [Canna indica]